VSADPGCGKSVLARGLVDGKSLEPIYYFFFKSDTEATRSATHAISALLRQICEVRRDLFHHVLPTLKQNGAKVVELSLLDEVLATLNAIVQDPVVGKMTILLDALNECDIQERNILLPRLATMVSSSNVTGTVKVLITSRPYDNIRISLIRDNELDLDQIRLNGEGEKEKDVIENEIELVIRTKVEAFRARRATTKNKDDAHIMLLDKIKGFENKTYLWVSAIFSKVETMANAPMRQLEKWIRTLPDDVDKAYKSILDQARDKDTLEGLKKTLCIILAATRPFTHLELNVALAPNSFEEMDRLQPDEAFENWIRELCGFFINIVHGEVFLIHQTAQDYLLQNSEFTDKNTWKHSFSFKDVNTMLARICIQYLLLFESTCPESRDKVLLSKQEFEDEVLERAYVTPHRLDDEAAVLESVEINTDSEASTSKDNEGSPHHRDDVHSERTMEQTRAALFRYAARNWDVHYENRSQDNDLYYGSKVLCGATSNVWRTWHIVITRGRQSHTPNGTYRRNYAALGEDISFHSSRGNITALQVIMDKKGYNAYSRDQKVFALLAAIESGKPWIVSKFLEKAIIPDYFKNDFLNPYKWKSPLSVSVELPDQGVGSEIVQLLLEKGFDPNVTSRVDMNLYDTPSHRAVRVGNIKTLKILVSGNANPRKLNSEGQTWLHSIVFFEEYVRYFGQLARAASLSGTSLSRLIELLITACTEAGVDINHVDKYGKKTLHIAVHKYAKTSVKELLQRGCDFTIRNIKGKTALQLAHAMMRNPSDPGHERLLSLDERIRCERWEEKLQAMRAYETIIKLLTAKEENREISDINISDIKESGPEPFDPELSKPASASSSMFYT
jgi:hypothetical protein